MNKIILGFVFCLLFFFPAFSFATSRGTIIDETLDKMELARFTYDVQQTKSFQVSSTPKEYLTPDKEKSPEPAETPLIPKVNKNPEKDIFYISGGYNANHMHYKELSEGNTLDEDYGKLKGFYINVGYKSNAYIKEIMGKPFIEAYFMRYDDLILYDGASKAGPIEFKERAEIQRFGIKLGAYTNFTKQGKVYGYFDVGERIWYRGENEVISGVLTYAEKYYWTYFGFGTGIDYKLIEKLYAGIGFEVMYSNSSLAKMRADLYEGGTFNLKNVYGIDLKFPIKYYLLKNISFDVTPYFTYWHIKASDPVLISGSYYIEPDSNTHIEGVFVGLTCTF